MKKILVTALALLMLWTIWGNTAIEVSEWTFSDARVPAAFDGFRIAQLSDLHNAQFGDGNKTLLSLLAQAYPDAIFLTGDLVDSRHPDFDVALELAAQAVAIAPTYYVPGNHESRLDYDSLRTRLTAAGVTVLEARAVIVRRGQDHIRILGIRDPDFYGGADCNHLEQIVANEHFEILLAHRPERMYRYEASGVDLVFAGHAHGGQFRLPGLGGMIAPGQGILPEYDCGMFTAGDTTMLLSRGLGNSLFPFRFNNRPEILVCTLKSA